MSSAVSCLIPNWKVILALLYVSNKHSATLSSFKPCNVSFGNLSFFCFGFSRVFDWFWLLEVGGGVVDRPVSSGAMSEEGEIARGYCELSCKKVYWCETSWNYNLVYGEVYLELYQTSKMELLAKLVNCWKSLTIST